MVRLGDWSYVPDDVYEESERSEKADAWRRNALSDLADRWLSSARQGVSDIVGNLWQGYQGLAEMEPREQQAAVFQRTVGDPLGRVGEAFEQAGAVTADVQAGLREFEAAGGPVPQLDQKLQGARRPNRGYQQEEYDERGPRMGVPTREETVAGGAGWDEALQTWREFKEQDPAAGLIAEGISPLNFPVEGARAVLGAGAALKGAGAAGLAFGGLKQTGKAAEELARWQRATAAAGRRLSDQPIDPGWLARKAEAEANIARLTGEQYNLQDALNNLEAAEKFWPQYGGPERAPEFSGPIESARKAIANAGGQVKKAVEPPVAAGGGMEPPRQPPLRGMEPPPPPEGPEPFASTEGARPITLSPEEEVARLRLDKFPEWAREPIAAAAQSAQPEAGGFARAQRRGVVPTEVSEQMADDIGRSVEQWIRDGKAGKAYNTEETRALRNAITAQAETVNDASKAVAAARDAGEVTDAMLARAMEEGERLRGLVTVAEGARAEWGRAGLAWRATTRAQAAPLENIERIYRKVGGRDNALKAVDEYNRMLEEGANPIQMAQFWSRIEQPPPGFLDWFNLVRYNSMMSGPRTVEINLVGNAMEVPWRLMRDFGASTLRGRPGEIVPEVTAMLAGFQRGLRPLMEVMARGITTEQALAGDMPRAVSSRVRNPVARGVATALEVPTRINQATDELFKRVAYSMQIGREAALTASREKRSGAAWKERVAELMAEPTPGMMKAAGGVAERMTFKGEMGTVGTALGGIQRIPILGNILLPFLRTVYHLTTRGIDRSPVGVVGTAFDVARGVYKPGRELPKGVVPLGERLGDNVMGTAVGAALVGYAVTGSISGNGPKDTEKRAMLRSTGWQPYSVKIGDQWVSYANWGPASIPFAMAASLAEAGLYAKPGSDDLAGQAMDTISRFGQLGTEQTYLQGIGAFYKAISDPDRYGARWLTGFMGSLVPYGRALGTVAQAGDPAQRSPERVSEVGLPEHVRQAMAVNFPGSRETVPATQDPLGRPVANIQTGAAAFQPFRASPTRSDPTIELLLKAGVDVPRAPQTVKNLPLTPEEKRRYEQVAGQALQQAIQRLLESRSYQQASEKGKAKLLQRMVEAARQRAATEALQTMGSGEARRRRLEMATP